MNTPNFNLEQECGFNIVAGCDEAGRGPLCGPVVAAAVIISVTTEIPCIINDSKKLSQNKRQIAYDWIMQNCIVGIGMCEPAEIDELNILWASMERMNRAIKNLRVVPEFVLVDGNRLPNGIIGRAVIGGDAKSISIAAASIIAKETRDKIMRELATEFPQYGWDKNSGYPTAAHLRAIKEYGINEHYRKSFGPIKELL
jgi:ribonuclease HII